MLQIYLVCIIAGSAIGWIVIDWRRMRAPKPKVVYSRSSNLFAAFLVLQLIGSLVAFVFFGLWGFLVAPIWWLVNGLFFQCLGLKG